MKFWMKIVAILVGFLVLLRLERETGHPGQNNKFAAVGYREQSVTSPTHDKPLFTRRPKASSNMISPYSSEDDKRFNEFTPTSNSFAKMTKPEIGLRCKVRYLGCFCDRNPGTFFQSQSTQLTSSERPQDCFEICSQKKKQLAAWTSTECHCGELFVRYKILSPSNSCERKALTYPQVNCSVGSISADIYLITKFCEKESLTEENISSYFLGIFNQPPNFQSETISASITSSAHNASVWCYLYCEGKEQTLSMITAAAKCHCGHTTDRFRLNNLRLNQTLTVGSHTVAVWRTAVQDNRCDLRIFLPSHTSEKIFLRSIPGSGNTWMRHLIESTTGVFTGSAYDDAFLATGGFLGEFDDVSSGRTLVIKEHSAGSEPSKNIILIRNPFDAIVAEFTRPQSHSHVGLGNTNIFKKSDWNSTVKEMANSWLSANISYLKKSSSHIIVYYEDLKRDRVKEMRRVVDFIGFKVNNLEKRLLCLQLEGGGLFKRPSRNRAVNPYSSDQTKLIDEKIRMLGSYLKDNTEDRTPLPNYERHY
ncbi:sialate:O-sulfotransferase 2-like isoform X2 [Clavelina lepadiformis]|uniref:sialate:O-sulfotransferase 2-like isoform X2 n=1 Tax=Clavelina lepadiformis TaxID=159417 RepID=UPI004042F7D9